MKDAAPSGKKPDTSASQAPDAGAVYLSIVIPAYNEEGQIGQTIRRVEAYLSQTARRWEIVVVNDGSKDGTERVAKALAGPRPTGVVSVMSFAKNRGKGFVVRSGVLAAAGKYILITDADLSAPIKEVDKLLKVLEDGTDVAIGSRAVKQKDCQVKQSFKRRLSGRIFNFFVRTLALGGIGDTQCGFKCFTRVAARDLFGLQQLDGFCFDVEVLYLARVRGYPIAEIPVMWRQGPLSKVSLIRDSFRMVKDLFFIKKIHAEHVRSHSS
jgi:dolichyl-phosphate beta-glucosyltransferase